MKMLILVLAYIATALAAPVLIEPRELLSRTPWCAAMLTVIAEDTQSLDAIAARDPDGTTQFGMNLGTNVLASHTY